MGAWIADNKSDELTPILYVLTDLSHLGGWYTAEEIPELRGTVQVAGDHLTEASHSALDETLGAVADLEAVEIRESVVDEGTSGALGCHPFMGGRAMLRLQKPLALGGRYFVEANVDQGCQGVVVLLRIEPVGSEFEVTQVIRDGMWIV